MHKGEGASVANESDAVGGYCKAVFDKGDAPREGDDADEGPVAANASVLKAQVTIPRKGHEDVAGEKKKDGLKG